MEAIKTRKTYDGQFKRDAAKLVVEGGRRASEVAKGLGINDNVLYRWIRQYKDDPRDSFPGKGHLKPLDEELRHLRRELEDVKEERDILKKAVGIFSKIRQ
jgi:transposase